MERCLAAIGSLKWICEHLWFARQELRAHNSLPVSRSAGLINRPFSAGRCTRIRGPLFDPPLETLAGPLPAVLTPRLAQGATKHEEEFGCEAAEWAALILCRAQNSCARTQLVHFVFPPCWLLVNRRGNRSLEGTLFFGFSPPIRFGLQITWLLRSFCLARILARGTGNS
jgi:hypothetical protein